MKALDIGLLRDRDYRGLFASTTVSQFAHQIGQLAMPLVAVLALEASELEIGLLFALGTAAFLVVGLPAGALVDRMRRRRVLIASDLGRAGLLLSVPVAWWAGVLTIWQLYAVALLAGVLTVFFDVAYQSYIPHLVSRDQLIEANAKLESVFAVARVGGPTVAGQLINLLTAPFALLVDAVALALSALFITGIRRREERPTSRPVSGIPREIAEGLRFVLGNRLLRAIVLCTATYSLFFAIYMSMLIVFLARVLGLSAGLVGAVFTIVGVGGLVGAATARRIAARLGHGRAIWMAAAFSAPFLLLMPLAEPGVRLWVAAAGAMVVSVGSVVYNVAQVSFRQAITPHALLGRMNATVRFLVWSTLPVGGVLGGFLGEGIGVRNTLWIAAAGLCLAFLPVFLSPLRTMRELPTDVVDTRQGTGGATSEPSDRDAAPEASDRDAVPEASDGEVASRTSDGDVSPTVPR